MKWPHGNLGQITRRFISGGTPSTKIPAYWQGSIPWITGADVFESGVGDPRRFINEIAVANSATNIVPTSSVLVVTRTGVGKLAIAEQDLAISQDLTGLVLKEGFIPKFVMLALRAQSDRLVSMQRGATIKGITRDDLAGLTIPLPPLSEQRRIVEILDQADALRRKRKEAGARAARLLPALFYDMFGDPATNPMGWEMRPVGSFATDVTNGLSRRRKSDEGADIVLRLRDIRGGWIDFSDTNRISLTRQEASRYQLSVGDLLFIRVNGNPNYVGRCAVFDGFGEAVYFNDHVMRVKTDQSRVSGKYLAFVLNGMHGKREIALYRKTSAGQHTISHEGLAKIRIPLPPLELQRKFAERVASVECLKSAQWASVGKVDDLFASLLHRAFSGDLTARWREAHLEELLAEMEQQAKALGAVVGREQLPLRLG